MRVVIADDSVLLREGIAQLLREGGFDVVAAVGNVEDLLAAVADHEPDIVIVDIRMPPTHTDEGLQAVSRLRADRPALPVLLLSQWVQAGQALALFGKPGAGLGYLLKDRVTDVDDFLDSLRRVARGGSAIDAEVVAALVVTGHGAGPIGRLTDRERQVLALMAEGRSNGALAERLFLSPKTVETHVNNIFTKLGLPPAPDDSRRVLAVLAWLREPHA